MTAWFTKAAKVAVALLILAAAGRALAIATDPVLDLIGTGVSKLAAAVAGFFGWIDHLVRHYTD